MKLTIDDPKLTAYALGELDAAECADIERVLAQSPELQAEVEAIRRTGEQLNRELASEPCPEFKLEESAKHRANSRTAGVAPELPQQLEQPRGTPSPGNAGWNWLLRFFLYGGATAMILFLVAALFLPRVEQIEVQGTAYYPPKRTPADGAGGSESQACFPQVELRRMVREDAFRGIPPSAVPAAPPGYWTYSPHDTESYARIDDNPFLPVRNHPLSTFSIDVDTASYANVRRFLAQQRTLPPRTPCGSRS